MARFPQIWGTFGVPKVQRLWHSCRRLPLASMERKTDNEMNTGMMITHSTVLDVSVWPCISMWVVIAGTAGKG